ncbi:MAG: hypothetical protein ACRELF_27925, partial [Gemmataceae bacterium]
PIPFTFQEQREKMRKLIWCCSAAGVFAAGSFLSLTYYAYRCPDSAVGRSMQVIAEASLAMQPLSGIASLAMHANHAITPAQQMAGSDEECVPDDPQPIAAERKTEDALICKELEHIVEAAPIVIGEDEEMPCEPVAQPVPATIEIPAAQGLRQMANGCPIVMPYCQDDGEPPITPPIMPHADGDEDKPVSANEKKADDSSEDSENKDFKEWMKLFEEEDKKDKSPTAEELPAPTEEEEPQAEPKCQEDSHLHEHYPGCPSVTCPYTGKSYPACEPPKQAGKEESSEEPPPHRRKKPHHGKGCQSEDECPRTPGVDTMEYRKSDGGLNEFGPGPLH